MSFLDGTRWVPEAELHAPSAPAARPTAGRRVIALALVLGLMLMLPLNTFAWSKSGATLSVTFNFSSTSGSMPYGTPYTVNGCGYDAANGGVTVVVWSPEATSFAGQIPDANGCIAVSNFSTQGPGTYSLT